jgi:hypothetical protein
LKGCSEAQEYEIADLIENRIIFSDPAAINIRVGHSYQVGDNNVGIDADMGVSPEYSTCYAARRLARIKRAPVPAKRNLDELFQKVISSDYEFDEELAIAVLLHAIDND